MENIKTKVLVIGGGIAGVQSALDLAEIGFKVELIEKYGKEEGLKRYNIWLEMQKKNGRKGKGKRYRKG